jgi:transposase
MIRFPITELMNEKECYDFLMNILHPDGLKCPNNHLLPENQAPHDLSRIPLVDYKCRICGCVYNLFSNTIWSGTGYDCVTIVLIIRGFTQGITTQQLADELNKDYGTLLKRRHQLQQLALENRPDDPLPDMQTESDEMFQNAGQKGEKHQDIDDPPRCRANKRKGRGTLENDRPPILGVVGRHSGQIRISVCDSVKQVVIQPKVEHDTKTDASVYTDECHAYEHLCETGRIHSCVNHSQGEWARDDDGDGIREVHCSTLEGIWTGLRNFLRPFRGVHKKYLAIYVVMFEWSYNLKQINANFLRALMIPNFTYLPI